MRIHAHLRHLHGQPGFEGRGGRLYNRLAKSVLRSVYRRLAQDIAAAAPDGAIVLTSVPDPVCCLPNSPAYGETYGSSASTRRPTWSRQRPGTWRDTTGEPAPRPVTQRTFHVGRRRTRPVRPHWTVAAPVPRPYRHVLSPVHETSLWA